MATKRELISELDELGVDKSKSELQKMTNRELEGLINDLKEDVVVLDDAPDKIDMEALKKQMMDEMKAEMEAKLRDEMMAEMKEKAKAEAVEEIKEEEPKRKVVVDKNRLIPVMNITNHTLVYQSRKTGAEWSWGLYGDTEYIEMQELLTMRSSQRRFLDEPWILIMDDEAVSYLGLEKMYDKMVHPDNIDSVFNMGRDQFKEVLDTAPKGIAQLIVSRAKAKVDDGTLDSVQKIKAINEKFGTHLGE